MSIHRHHASKPVLAGAIKPTHLAPTCCSPFVPGAAPPLPITGQTLAECLGVRSERSGHSTCCVPACIKSAPCRPNGRAGSSATSLNSNRWPATIEGGDAVAVGRHAERHVVGAYAVAVEMLSKSELEST